LVLGRTEIWRRAVPIKAVAKDGLISLSGLEVGRDPRDGSRQILRENRFNSKTIFKAILATLERISDYSLESGQNRLEDCFKIKTVFT